MKRLWCSLLLGVVPWPCQAQVGRITIPAGTPADQDLQVISKETDSQKKIAAYEEFVQK
jgi:hypothetical protein